MEIQVPYKYTSRFDKNYYSLSKEKAQADTDAFAKTQEKQQEKQIFNEERMFQDLVNLENQYQELLLQSYEIPNYDALNDLQNKIIAMFKQNYNYSSNVKKKSNIDNSKQSIEGNIYKRNLYNFTNELNKIMQNRKFSSNTNLSISVGKFIRNLYLNYYALSGNSKDLQLEEIKIKGSNPDDLNRYYQSLAEKSSKLAIAQDLSPSEITNKEIKELLTDQKEKESENVDKEISDALKSHNKNKENFENDVEIKDVDDNIEDEKINLDAEKDFILQNPERQQALIDFFGKVKKQIKEVNDEIQKKLPELNELESDKRKNGKKRMSIENKINKIKNKENPSEKDKDQLISSVEELDDLQDVMLNDEKRYLVLSKKMDIVRDFYNFLIKLRNLQTFGPSETSSDDNKQGTGKKGGRYGAQIPVTQNSEEMRYEKIDRSTTGIGSLYPTRIKSAYSPYLDPFPLNQDKRPMLKKISGGDIFTYSDFTNSSKAVLKENGNKKIVEIELFRSPIDTNISSVLNAITLGKLKANYDELFHLGMVVTLEDGTKVLIEKNENIVISKQLYQAQETMNVPVDKEMTLDALLLRTKQRMGEDNFFKYGAFDHNCQDFILNILNANNMLTSENEKFIYQDLTKLIEDTPYLVRKIADLGTTAKAFWNKIRGVGKHKSVAKKRKGGTIIFSEGVDFKAGRKKRSKKSSKSKPKPKAKKAGKRVYFA